MSHTARPETAAKLGRLLEEMRRGESLRPAAQRVGISARTVYGYKEDDPEFSRALLDAARVGRSNRWAHGTHQQYRRGCRCEVCTTANTERCSRQRQDRSQREPIQHGTSAYINARCRCDVCVKAMRTIASSFIALNAESRDVAGRHGYQWTGPELELVSRRDLTAKELAGLLGRTITAVNSARSAARRDPRKRRLAGIPRSAKL